MAITSALSLDLQGDLTPPGIEIGAGFDPDMDVVRLEDGGYAVLANNADGVEVNAFDENGDGIGTFTSGGPGGSIAQLGNGDLVLVHQVGNSQQFLSFDPSLDEGLSVGIGPALSAFGGTTDADVGAGESSFAVASQLAVGDLDSDIVLEIYAVGEDRTQATPVKTITIDDDNPNDGFGDASVAVLKNGSVAVAWTRTDVDGGTALMYAVYDANGDVVREPGVLNDTNGINRDASLVATEDGFAVAFVNRVFSFRSEDIRLKTFDFLGEETDDELVTNRFANQTGEDDGSDDADPFLSAGPDGNLVVSYTRTVDGEADVVLAVFGGGDFLAEIQANFDNDDEQQAFSAVTFFGTGQIGVFDVLGDGTFEAEQYDGFRDAAGDAEGQKSDDLIVGDDFRDLLNGDRGSDTLDGGRNDDELLGGAGADTLTGGDGDDTLNGEDGFDRADGGRGNDTYFVSLRGDVAQEIIGGKKGGVDTVFSTAEIYDLGQNIENLVLFTAVGVVGQGNELNNKITGSAGDDDILGREGADTLLGGKGNDTLDGDVGKDRMEGGRGRDVYVVDDVEDRTIETIAGKAGGVDLVTSSVDRNLGENFENLTLVDDAVRGAGNQLKNVMTGSEIGNELSGLKGADRLIGGAGADSLDGGDDRDVLIGGTGVDRLTGGSGRDRFVFEDGKQGRDVVTDFAVEEDRFDLSGRSFLSREVSRGDTTLTYQGGEIVVRDVKGLSLGDWNDLVVG